ncbi:MAG: diguanylate cyclase [Campylobacterota bacterium]|nr:diguanylate cyclase [Campylobacterota bacterium]
MMPTIEDICIKDIVSVDLNTTVEDAVKQMTTSNLRTILVTGDKDDDFYILTTNDAIEFKIQNISMKTKLSNIVLQRIRKIDATINILEILNQDTIKNEYMAAVKSGKVIGILSQTDIINNIDPKILLQKQSLENIIMKYTAITVYENESTVNAIKVMKFKNIDSVIIINNDREPLGIFTTKDFLTAMHCDANLNEPIKTFMSSPLQTVCSDIKIFDALEFIKEKHFKRLVVTDTNGKITGVVTQTELLRLVNNKWLDLIKQKGLELSRMNQKLIEETANLEAKASTDFLTQLHNRRKFDSLMEYEIKQVQRNKDRYLSVILIDIDSFKFINDTYGHDIGDMILGELANILKVSSRTSDIVSRWGGEEFCIGLPNTNIEDAVLVAEKIRITIENYIFAKDLKITCSFGVSQLHETDTYTNLFKRTDEALYKAKHTGKNKVIMEQIEISL